MEKREAAEDRTFTNSNLSAAVQNLTGSFWLLKALLIYWIHVSISTIYLISMCKIMLSVWISNGWLVPEFPGLELAAAGSQ